MRFLSCVISVIHVRFLSCVISLIHVRFLSCVISLIHVRFLSSAISLIVLPTLPSQSSAVLLNLPFTIHLITCVERFCHKVVQKEKVYRLYSISYAARRCGPQGKYCHKGPL